MQMCAKVEKGLIGVRSPRGIKWYRFGSIRISIEVSRKKKADTLSCRYLLASERASLESTVTNCD